jgi:ribosomal protein S18 acetylase RimI-like enzyme
MDDSSYRVRRATEADAGGIAHVLGRITAERTLSAIDRAWPPDEQRAYLRGLSDREAFHVAEAAGGAIVGYQSLDRYSTVLTSMAHAGTLGTFVLPEWRGRGVGRALFDATVRFACAAGYRKLVIFVRGANFRAQAFYSSLGFAECGRLRRQVVLDDAEDDEVVMELFLEGGAAAEPAARP